MAHTLCIFYDKHLPRLVGNKQGRVHSIELGVKSSWQEAELDHPLSGPARSGIVTSPGRLPCVAPERVLKTPLRKRLLSVWMCEHCWEQFPKAQTL